MRVNLPPSLVYMAAELITGALFLTALVAYDHWRHSRANKRLDDWRRRRDGRD